MTDVQPTSVQEREVKHRQQFCKFSPEELRVWKECNSESFYYRSLPFSVALGSLAMYGVKSGFLKGNSKWGPWPKVVLGAALGYLIGKVSYQRKCVEKLMALPNSHLAVMMHEKKEKSKEGSHKCFNSKPINTMDSQGHPDLESGNQTDTFKN